MTKYKVSFKGVVEINCKEEELDEKLVEKFSQDVNKYTLIFEE